jgi:hypothetical protein
VELAYTEDDFHDERVVSQCCAYEESSAENASLMMMMKLKGMGEAPEAKQATFSGGDACLQVPLGSWMRKCISSC